MTSEEVSQKIDCEVKTQLNEFLRLKRSIKCPNLWLKIDPNQTQKLQASELSDRCPFLIKKEVERQHCKPEDSAGAAF